MIPVLAVRNLVKEFSVRGGGTLHAVSNVSFELFEGETVGLVGESGCGKSTVGQCVVRLIEPTAGEVMFRGRDVLRLSRKGLRDLRADLQIVFQDPLESLNPRMQAGSIVGEPLIVHGATAKAARARALDLLELVGLDRQHAGSYPHEFSSGQRQRICVARALALNPDVVILDEPVSSLDVSIQAGILNLLEDLRDELHLSYLFVAHDLSVVRHIADRVAVMYLGKIVETGRRDDIYDHSAHPYTQALLSAVPMPNPSLERSRQRIVLVGDLPNPANPPSGCRFRTRCWKAQDVCAREEPALIDRGQGHPAACHFAEELQIVP
jgi:peptide/nickel transport system ATP-binding protein/oligopeptide transport system ATP-binding protein